MTQSNEVFRKPPVIGVFGRKGGSGKTLISHLLAYGLGQLRCMPIVVQTDVDVDDLKPIEFVTGRPYLHKIFRVTENDDYTMKQLEDVFLMASKMHNPIVIFDGGANRRKVDHAFARISDLILLPTADSRRDLVVADNDLKDFQNFIKGRGQSTEISIVLNNWPAPKKREALMATPEVKKYIDAWNEQGVIYPVVLSSMRSLVEMSDANAPVYNVVADTISRDFCSLIAHRFGIDTSEEALRAALGSNVDSDNIEHPIAAE